MNIEELRAINDRFKRIEERLNEVANREIRAFGSAWNGQHFTMGNYHFWVDVAGKLRMKNDSPSFDTDGIVVGSQV